VTVGGISIAAGSRATVELPIPRLYTHTDLSMPVQVVHGRQAGPRMFVSAAIHGDELNGVEIVRRLLRLPVLRRLRGTLLAVPIVNVHGCIHRSRYLPDGRDLNRVFPGSDKGSLAARMAHVFMTEVVAGSDFGIDLHTGAGHRANLPHVRAWLDDERTQAIARAFGAPVVIHSDLRDGSLRQAVIDAGIPMLVYEAGEALRFHELAVRGGVQGIVSVMRLVGMLPASRKHPRAEPVLARSTSWIRAPSSGVLRAVATLGAMVRKDAVLGYVSDPFGENEVAITAPSSGVIIGRLNLPLVHEGEALFNLARFEKGAPVEETVEAFHAEFEPDGNEMEPPIV
jgi:predicted deacylase